MVIESARSISTRKGKLSFPAYVPVTTFDEKHPLDKLLRPYLPRLATAVMVSYHYARQNNVDSPLPTMIDSGGFFSLMAGTTVVEDRGLGVIVKNDPVSPERVHPSDVLDVQEAQADIAFTLDFPVPIDATKAEAHRRIDLSLSNAFWALENRRRQDLPLYASVPVTNIPTLRRCIKSLSDAGFDGLALGGLVPRAKDLEFVVAATVAARSASPDLPLHIFGLGKPRITSALFEAGADSVDSSSYVRSAARGRLWGLQEDAEISEPTQLERLHIALCNLASVTGVPVPIAMRHMAFSTYSLLNQRLVR
jgi:tRNA-guanine family transglycosylase